MGRVRELNVKGVAWRVREEFADFLLDSGALEVWELAKHPSARLVKSGAHRRVFRVRLHRQDNGEAVDLFVKEFLLPRVRDLVRYLFRRSRGMREWRTAEFLEKAGIPTAPRVAVGRRRVARVLLEDCIITEAVSEVTALDVFVREELSKSNGAPLARTVREATPVLAGFIRALHDRGVLHRDFHAGNVLVRTEVTGGRRLMLIDLHAVKCGPPLSIGARLRNLTQFNRFFSMTVPRTARLRFWKAYVAGIPFLERNWRAYARLLEEHTAISCRRFWKRRQKHCLRTNRHFRKLRMRGVRGYTVRGDIQLPEDVFRRVPSEGMMMPDAVVLKDSKSSTVSEQRIDFGGGIRSIIIKQKRRKPGWGYLRSFLRGVGAMREWRTAYAMRIRGLPAVEALAAFERRSFGLLSESCLVTEKVENAGNLQIFTERTFAGELSRQTARLRRRMARALGRLIRRLHDLGFTQRDLKPSNILVTITGEAGEDFRFTLIDFEGVRQRARVSDALRARDLGTVAANFVATPAVRATDMMHCLDGYLSGRSMSRARRRQFIAAIRRRIEEKLEKWRRAESSS